MKIEILKDVLINQNTYFLHDDNALDGIMIDCGSNKYKIDELFDKNGYKPLMILLTHPHFDHILSVEYVRKKYNIDAYVHEYDTIIASDPEKNYSDRLIHKISLNDLKTFKDNDIFKYRGIEIKVLHTPGHTKGSVCFYIEKLNILFSGDTMFEGSYGRTDLYSGNYYDMQNSINNILLKLPANTVVYPGHNNQTTINIESTMHYF